MTGEDEHPFSKPSMWDDSSYMNNSSKEDCSMISLFCNLTGPLPQVTRWMSCVCHDKEAGCERENNATSQITKIHAFRILSSPLFFCKKKKKRNHLWTIYEYWIQDLSHNRPDPLFTWYLSAKIWIFFPCACTFNSLIRIGVSLVLVS